MDKTLDSPWFLRITALFLAILLFLNVQADDGKLKKNAGSEDMEVIRGVPVEVYYDDENLIVTGIPETVDVTIEGPINIVQTTKLVKDFTLSVDLRSFVMGEHEVHIQHENISEKLQVRIDPETINVNIEEKITETFRIEAEFNERSLAEGYNVTSMDVAPSTIEITGAKSVIESIAFVKATVSAEDGVQESFEKDATIRVLDRDLNKLDVEIASASAKVKVNIEENSKEVPIVLTQKGTPPTGVTVNSITPETEKIVLSGPKRILNEIENLSVEVDVTKIIKSGTIDVKLSTPNEVIQLSTTTLKVKVDVTVEEMDGESSEEIVEDSPEEIADVGESETNGESSESNESDNQEQTASPSPEPTPDPVEIKTMQIKGIPIVVTGLDAQFRSVIVHPENGTIVLTVKGTSDAIDALGVADFTASVDASTVKEAGENTLPLIINGPPKTEWTSSNNEAIVTVELI